MMWLLNSIVELVPDVVNDADVLDGDVPDVKAKVHIVDIPDVE